MRKSTINLAMASKLPFWHLKKKVFFKPLYRPGDHVGKFDHDLTSRPKPINDALSLGKSSKYMAELFSLEWIIWYGIIYSDLCPSLILAMWCSGTPVFFMFETLDRWADRGNSMYLVGRHPIKLPDLNGFWIDERYPPVIKHGNGNWTIYPCFFY